MQPVPASSRPIFLAVFLAFALVAILTLFSVSEDLKKSLTGGKHSNTLSVRMCTQVADSCGLSNRHLVPGSKSGLNLGASEDQLRSGSP